MDIKIRSALLGILLIVLCAVLPILITAPFYQEENVVMQTNDVIPAEPVKSITNKFVESRSLGAAGGLASTEIEVFSASQFLNKTAGEPVYSSVNLYDYTSGSYRIFDRTYASLIKDRSGVYTYHDEYKLDGYVVKDYSFDGRTICWQKNNFLVCLVLWLIILLAMIAASYQFWGVLRRRRLVY